MVGPGWVARRRLDSDRAFSDFEICQRRMAVPAQRRTTIGMMVLGLSQAGVWAGRIRGSSAGLRRASDISAENGKTLGSEQDRKRRRSDLVFGWVVGWVA